LPSFFRKAQHPLVISRNTDGLAGRKATEHRRQTMNRTSPIDRPRSSNRLPRILLVLAAALAHTASAQASRQARPSDVFLAQHPQPTSYLTDAADMVSATDERFLEVELYRLECRYGAQMGVVTVATTGTQPIEEFSLAVASMSPLPQ